MRQEFNAHRIFGAQRWRPWRCFGIPMLPTPWIQLKTKESLISRLIYPRNVPVNSKMLIPLGIPRAFEWSVDPYCGEFDPPSRTFDFRRCQYSGQRRKQKDFVILSPSSICATFTGAPIFAVLLELWESLKKPVYVGFLEWTVLLQWTNLQL